MLAEKTEPEHTYDTNIFINCPFDNSFKPIFDALVFSSFLCGFLPRCALEVSDGGQVRLEKILKIISTCRLGVHDISRTELDETSGLPRFNMPFELGLFLGAARFGVARQRQKSCLILDREKYRFQIFISDIAGQDISAHHGDPEQAIVEFRQWLATLAIKQKLPGGSAIVDRYRTFVSDLPTIMSELKLKTHEMTFADYINVVVTWIAAQSSA